MTQPPLHMLCGLVSRMGKSSNHREDSRHRQRGDRGRQAECQTAFVVFEKVAIWIAVRPPGIEWKTGQNPKMEKNWPKNRKWPSVSNGEKLAQKWQKNGIWGHSSFFFAIFGPFFPISGRGPFLFFGQFFPIFGFGPFSILYQAA